MRDLALAIQVFHPERRPAQRRMVAQCPEQVADLIACFGDELFLPGLPNKRIGLLRVRLVRFE